MKRHDEDPVGAANLDENLDASDLDPNAQAVLSQQTAPNRTPSDQVEEARGEGAVGTGDQPNPPGHEGAERDGQPGPLHGGTRPTSPSLRKTSDPSGADS